MTTQTVQRHEIVLGGVRYPIIGPVRPVLLSQYPPKQLIGAPGPDDEPFLSNWTITDHRGGMGVDVLDPRDPRHVARFWWATAWTLTRGIITLPPLATDCGNPTTSTDCDLSWEYDGEQFFAFGTNVYKWIDASATWSGVLTTLPATPTDVVVYRTTSSAVVVLACGATTVTYDGTTWTTHASVASTWLALWDDKVWKLADNGQLAYSTDPHGGIWTNDAVLRVASRDISGLLTGAHPDTKDPVLYAVTTSGLWIHDDTANKFEQTDFVLPARKNAGRGSSRWRAMVYFPTGMSVYQFNPVDHTVPVVTPVGPDLDDGMPQEMLGSIVRLVPTHNWLLALLDSTSSGTVGLYHGLDTGLTAASFPTRTGYTSVLAYNTLGWHTLFRSSQSSFSGHMLAVSLAYGEYRLWFGIDRKVFFLPLDMAVSNPRHDPTRTFAPGPAYYVTPAFNAGMAGKKLGVSLEVFTEGCSTTETVQVEVEYDRSGVWEPLGTITTNGRTTYLLETTSGQGDGRVYDSIRFRFTLRRGSTSTARPLVAYAVHPYLPLLDPIFGFDVEVDCSRTHGGRTAHQLRHALVAAAQTRTLLDFSYQDERVHTYKVRVHALEGAEHGGILDQGVFRVRLMMVTDANQPSGWT